MSANLIFSIVLFSQVILLSWYLPRRVQSRLRYVLDNYPAKDYPRLYKSDQASAERSVKYLAWFNQVMLLVGLGILLWVNLYSELFDGGISAAVSFVYGMVQAAPLILMDLGLMRHYKELRENDDRPKRTAELTPRSIFNHTTPLKLGAVMALFVIAVSFDMYTKNFDLGLGFELFEAFAILLACNLFFTWLVRKRVYGKKLNPYLDHKDNEREVGIVVASAMFTSVAVSVFFMAMRAINVYNLEDFEGVLMSIYMQAIMGYSMLYSMSLFDIKEMNFEPFRADAD